MPDGGTRIPLRADSFGDFLAQRVRDLEQDRAALRRRVARLEKSRELMQLRYDHLRRTSPSDAGRRFRQREAQRAA